MSVFLIALVFLSSLGWTFFDLSRKKLAVFLNPIPTVILLMFFQLPLFGIWSALETWQLPTSDYYPLALLCVFFNVIANVCFIQSVFLAPLSLSIPLLSFTPVYTAVGSYFFLGETLNFQQILGIVLVTCGALALNFAIPKNSESVDSQKVKKGMSLMMLVALLWSATPILDKMCLQFSAPAMHAFWQCLGIAVILIPWQIYKHKHIVSFVKFKKSLPWLLVAVFSASVALLAQFTAFSQVSIGLFEALKRAFGLLGAQIFGYLFFKETLNVKKLLAVVIMMSGVFLVLL